MHICFQNTATYNLTCLKRPTTKGFGLDVGKKMKSSCYLKSAQGKKFFKFVEG